MPGVLPHKVAPSPDLESGTGAIIPPTAEKPRTLGQIVWDLVRAAFFSHQTLGVALFGIWAFLLNCEGLTNWSLDSFNATLWLAFGLALFELLTRLLTKRVGLLPANFLAEPTASVIVTVLLVTIATGLLGEARLSAPGAQASTEAPSIVLTYALLVGIVALGRWKQKDGEGGNADLEKQVRNLKAQCGDLKAQCGDLKAQCGDLKAQCGDLKAQNDELAQMLLKAQESGAVAIDDDDTESMNGEHALVIEVPDFVMLPSGAVGLPQIALPHCLLEEGGRKPVFDRAHALKIARRLRKPNYRLSHFFEDCVRVFPEMKLYLATKYVEPSDEDAESFKGEITSYHGQASTEYKRTIGALFAVYWLVRIGIDGERGFSLGVDEQWAVYPAPTKEDLAEGAPEPPYDNHVKRRAFLKNQDWACLQRLIVESGMLKVGIDGQPVINPERAMAMLALTAFHDIMKVEAILPVVAEEHAPYLGFKAGDTINDHDIALGYVLDFHPETLPSYAAMNDEDRKTIRFTQSKMAFNHGWLVQGEAPPAPLFAKFKDVMLSEGCGKADVAFYFVHWLTDLAGAVPNPTGGGEKFVLQFPHAVLDSFIRSFPVLNELANKTETEVMEDYLLTTWAERPGAGPAPHDDHAIAQMRLTLQSQTPDKQKALLKAYGQLPVGDQHLLANEMARTGIEGQTFSRGPAGLGKDGLVEGPSFLVYYSPAYLRNFLPADALPALKILAEVYRRSREVWPLKPTKGNSHSVTIRIDQFKDLKMAEMIDGYGGQASEPKAANMEWLLVKKNDNEGVVERHPTDAVAKMKADGVVTANVHVSNAEDDLDVPLESEVL